MHESVRLALSKRTRLARLYSTEHTIMPLVHIPPGAPPPYPSRLLLLLLMVGLNSSLLVDMLVHSNRSRNLVKEVLVLHSLLFINILEIIKIVLLRCHQQTVEQPAQLIIIIFVAPLQSVHCEESFILMEQLVSLLL